MITLEKDNIIEDWGGQLYPSPRTGSKGRNIRGGGQTQPSQNTPQLKSSVIRQKIYRTVHKTAEVMVKISGGGKNMPHIKSHIDYISRHGQLELEDENGDLHQGKQGLHNIKNSWAKGRIGIPHEGEKRKEAFNIVLSMPPGTDRPSVKEAARAFAQEQFKDYQYVLVAHNDEKHPHVHLCVKAVDRYGIRLNPRKGDLQFWREQFAEKMRDQGIAANATPRQSRGIVQKAEKQVIRHLDRSFQHNESDTPSRISQAQKQAAKLDINNTKQHVNPAKENIQKTRRNVQIAYGQIARYLAKGNADDKQLALNIAHFVKTMPLPVTKHEALKEMLSHEMRENVMYNPERIRLNRGHSQTEKTR